MSLSLTHTILPFATRLMDLISFMLSKIRDKYIILLKCGTEKKSNKFIDTDNGVMEGDQKFS